MNLLTSPQPCDRPDTLYGPDPEDIEARIDRVLREVPGLLDRIHALIATRAQVTHPGGT